MPTYQYRCAQCGEQFDAWQSIHDDALTTHDGDCGGALMKVLGVGGIVLKGPGFYRTDNRSKAAGREAKRESDSSKSADKAKGAGTNGSGDSKSSDGASKSKSEPAGSGASKGDSSTS